METRLNPRTQNRLMRMLRSKTVKASLAVLLVLAILRIGVFVRVSTTLPALDSARIHHWIWHDEWSAVASALWEETDFNAIYKVYDGYEYEIEAYGGDFSLEPIELTPSQISKYDELFAASHLGRMYRSDGSVYIENIGAADRFGRTILADLVYPREGYTHAEECDGQYRNAHEGFCEVRLGSEWLIRYSWFLPPEQNWARCAGVWREYDSNADAVDIPPERRWGTGEYFEQAVDELGEAEAEIWVASGSEALRAARASARQEEAGRLIELCTRF